MKIRGNAQHVAEKYLQLARDAHTGGDPVAAENYLQHAEHYFRIIAAAQAAQALAQGGQPRPSGEGDSDDLDDDDDYSALSDRFASPSERAPQFPQQQPYQGQPSVPNAPQPFVDRSFDGDRQGQNDRGGFQPRQDRQGNRFPDRGPRQDRPFGDRGEGYRDNRQNRDQRQRDFRPYREPAPQPKAPEAAVAPGLPSFITGPARPSPGDQEGSLPPLAPPPADVENGDQTLPPFGEASGGEGRFQPRGRRRRLRSPYGFNAPHSDQDQSGAPSEPVSDEPPANE